MTHAASTLAPAKARTSVIFTRSVRMRTVFGKRGLRRRRQSGWGGVVGALEDEPADRIDQHRDPNDILDREPTMIRSPGKIRTPLTFCANRSSRSETCLALSVSPPLVTRRSTLIPLAFHSSAAF